MYDSLNEATAFTDRAIYRLVPVRTISSYWILDRGNIHKLYTLAHGSWPTKLWHQTIWEGSNFHRVEINGEAEVSSVSPLSGTVLYSNNLTTASLLWSQWWNNRTRNRRIKVSIPKLRCQIRTEFSQDKNIRITPPWFIRRGLRPRWINHVSTRCLKITGYFFTRARF